MRLSEDKIKEAILHPERLVRRQALRYFAESYSLDTSVMPLVIRSVEQFGRAQGLRYADRFEKLAQTADTVRWAVGELNRVEDKEEDFDHYFPALTRMLSSADPRLLVPHEQEILQSVGFDKEDVPAFRERLELLSWDADRCWKELESICEQGVREESAQDLILNRADRLVEAIARDGERYTERILELLAREITDFDNDPMVWMEIFLVDLAGEMRLTAALPAIVSKLQHDGDFLLESCQKALSKIGTEAAVELIAGHWGGWEWAYRLYACGALENIHTDATMRTCLQLLPQESDRGLKTNLACALMWCYDPADVEPVRQMVVNRRYDPQTADLEGDLATACTIMGVTFPELAAWKRRAEEREEQIERRIKEMMRTQEEAPLPPPPRAPESSFYERPSVPFEKEKQKVGRNDPCPCGSGKKFKKCCMNKGGG
jgi:hypothetical protein